MEGIKEKNTDLFKTNTTKDYYYYYKGRKKTRKPKTDKEKIRKQSENNKIKDFRNLFRVLKVSEAIKDKIMRDIRTLFEEEEEENYYKPVRIGTFYGNKYIEHESNCDKDKTPSMEEYLHEIKPYLKDINNLKKSVSWKTQSTLAINIISSKGTNEEQVMHSWGDNIEIMINVKAGKVVKEHFESVLSRYQIGL